MRSLMIGWMAAAVLSTSALAAGPPPPPDYARQLDAVAQTYAKADRFAGVVLVARDGKPIFRKAYGLANREWDIAATPETRYRLGSITKQFTAAAILQLAEQGKLSLDDPISKYYAAAPPAWAPITLKHLLTHTSGIPSYTALPTWFAQLSRDEKSPEQIIELTRDKPLEFKPGEKFAYNNTGYVLLGYVIEKVSGQAYRNYLKANIFEPLGMKDSGYDISAEILPRRAAGYELMGGKITNTPYLAMSQPYAAGSLYSTVDDLLKWDLALRGGKVIGPASVKAMFTDYGFKYGYGQFIETRDGRPYWSHGGGINGFITSFGRYPDDGVTIVVLSNLTRSDMARVAFDAGDLYFNPEHGAGPSGPATAAELDRYVGRYRMSDAVTVSVTREGDRLYGEATGVAKAELMRELGRTFYGPAAILRFAEGAKAPEVAVTVRGQGETVAKRID
jgi:CubicO group peptidase (beta-lactamase class C family)